VSRLIAAEILKLRTTRTALVLTLCALALAALVVTLSSVLAHHFTRDDVDTLLSNQVALLFVAILAVVSTTGEERHRTLAGTLLAAPVRWRVLAAKAAAYFAAGALLTVAITLLDLAIALPILSGKDADIPSAAHIAGTLGRNVLATGLFAMLGVGLGAAVRNQPAALIILLVLGFVIEPTLQLAPSVYKFAPFASADSLSGFSQDENLPPGFGGLVLVGWTSLLLGLGMLVWQRRDVT
jgi:ABC-type transport system involved in multi-copper enzyme maturation permease subunit